MATDPHADALAEARRIWSRVEVDESQFAEFLASKTISDPARISDLFIAFAAVSRHPRAAHSLQEAFAPQLRKALAGLRLTTAQVDDVLQSAWRDLLAGDSPRIAQFDGSGDLRAWLRVSVTRMGLRVLKKTKRESSELEAGEIAESASADPELMLMKATYRADFHEAVKLAIDAMAPAEAMLLRQHFVDGLGIDELGKLYGVHRATAARRLASARDSLVLSIRMEFKQRSRLGDSECESALRLVRSGLDITLRRHFAAK
ncbi:MAG: sigma-70 family RNA polymerase sigma factor [Polyangiaceae bacterium]